VKFVTPILLALARSLPGNAQIEPGDGLLRLNEQGALSYTPPLPIYIASAGFNKDLRSSDIVFNDLPFTVDTNTLLCRLLEGVWNIDLVHSIQALSVGDPTAFGTVTMQSNFITPPVAVASNNLSIIRATTQTVVMRNFTITVDAKVPLSFFHFIENGAGTSNNRSQVSLICNRIL